MTVPDVRLKIELTLPGQVWRGRREAAERGLYERFGRLTKRLRREYGQEVEYLAVVEWHRSRLPHMHVLLRGVEHIPHGWLSRHARESGFGPVCWVRGVSSAADAADYVSGASKAAAAGDVAKASSYELRGDYAKGLRRIRCSRRWWASAQPECGADEEREAIRGADAPAREMVGGGLLGGRVEEHARAALVGGCWLLAERRRPRVGRVMCRFVLWPGARWELPVRATDGWRTLVVVGPDRVFWRWSSSDRKSRAFPARRCKIPCAGA